MTWRVGPLSWVVLVTLPLATGVCGVSDGYLSGFGTLSAACLGTGVADFVNNTQAEGPGRSGRCDLGLDSVLGLQLDAALTPSLDLAVQIVADRQVDHNFAPDISVAQLRWRFADATTLRLGRMPTPAFLHAEDRKVRYAHPWVRPPLEVYDLVPGLSSDGLEVIYQGRWGSWHAEWQGGFAAVDFDAPSNISADNYAMSTAQGYLILNLRDVNSLIKVGYSYGKASIDHPAASQLFSALRSLGGAVGAALADDLAVDDAPLQLFAIGARHEQNDWLLMGEFAYRTLDGFVRDQTGAYMTLGRRFDLWMPYGTLARRWTSGPDTDSRAGLFGSTAQAAVDGLLATSRLDSTSVSLGLARELNKQATLKLQADWIRPDKDSWGLFTNHGPTYDFAHPGSSWLLTLSLDFLF